MALVKRRKLPPPRQACKECKTAFKPGDCYHTTLKEEEKIWSREDRCSVCFKPTDAISWKGKICETEEQELSCSNEKILEELLVAEDPLWITFLAEVLLRKGILRWRGTKFIEVVQTAELIELERQTLPLKELPDFHFRLEKLIERA